MSDTLSYLSDNEAEISFEQDQEQEAEQNAANVAEQENTVEGPIVVLFIDINIFQVNVADQDITQVIVQDQDQVLADVGANALAGAEDAVSIEFGDFDALFA